MIVAGMSKLISAELEVARLKGRTEVKPPVNPSQPVKQLKYPPNPLFLFISHEPTWRSF